MMEELHGRGETGQSLTSHETDAGDSQRRKGGETAILKVLGRSPRAVIIVSTVSQSVIRTVSIDTNHINVYSALNIYIAGGEE